ncbi:MAG: SpaA isopeptide-forming pilin-related protein [Oscillospiraceae bacterium]
MEKTIKKAKAKKRIISLLLSLVIMASFLCVNIIFGFNNVSAGAVKQTFYNVKTMPSHWQWSTKCTNCGGSGKVNHTYKYNCGKPCIDGCMYNSLITPHTGTKKIDCPNCTNGKIYSNGNNFLKSKSKTDPYAKNNIAYCLDNNKQAPTTSGIAGTKGNNDNNVKSVMYYGYPQQSIKQLGATNADVAYDATQLAIYAMQGTLSHNNQGMAQFNGMRDNNGNAVTVAKKILANALANPYVEPKANVTITTNHEKTTVAGNFYNVGNYTVKLNGTANKTANVVLKTAPTGTKIIKNGSNFYFQLPINTKLENALIEATVTTSKTGVFDIGTYILPSKYQRMGTIELKPIVGTAKVLKVFDSPKGELLITKKGDNGKLLAGAVFKLTHQTLGTTYNITANEKGVANIKRLLFGKWKIEEIKAPTGYVLDKTPQFVTLDDKQTQKLDIVFINSNIKGDVALIKTDKDTGSKLSGAVFGLYQKTDNKLVAKLTTDKNGYAKSQLVNFGEYYLQEITAPVGYVLDPTQHKLNITTNKQTINLTATNVKIKGAIEIIKMSDNPLDAIKQGFENEPLENAVYGVFSNDGKLVQTMKPTDKNGYAKSELLNFGEYYLQEITAPEHYKLDVTKYNFKVTADGLLLHKDVKNQPIIGYIEASLPTPPISELIDETPPPTSNMTIEENPMTGVFINPINILLLCFMACVLVLIIKTKLEMCEE